MLATASAQVCVPLGHSSLYFIICGRPRALAGMLTSSPTNQDLIDSSAWGEGHVVSVVLKLLRIIYLLCPCPIGWGMMH